MVGTYDIFNSEFLERVKNAKVSDNLRGWKRVYGIFFLIIEDKHFPYLIVLDKDYYKNPKNKKWRSYFLFSSEYKFLKDKNNRVWLYYRVEVEEKMKEIMDSYTKGKFLRMIDIYEKCDYREKFREINRSLTFKMIEKINSEKITYKEWKKEYDLRFYFIINKLGLLDREAYLGMDEAVKLYFKLYILADKQKYRDEIIFILGNLIRINPELFLKESDYLLKSENKLKEKLFNEILTKFTFDYKNNSEYELFEIRERIKAIKRVKDKRYGKIKNKCLRLLEEREKEFMKKVKEVKIDDIVKFIERQASQQSDEDYPLMEKEVYSGNRAIFPLFFKKMGKNDRDQYGFSIVLTILIRINPVEELKKEDRFSRYNNLLLSFFSRCEKDELIETELRIKSLEKVKKKDLIEIRDKCISKLRE